MKGKVIEEDPQHVCKEPAVEGDSGPWKTRSDSVLLKEMISVEVELGGQTAAAKTDRRVSFDLRPEPEEPPGHHRESAGQKEEQEELKMTDVFPGKENQETSSRSKNEEICRLFFEGVDRRAKANYWKFCTKEECLHKT